MLTYSKMGDACMTLSGELSLIREKRLGTEPNKSLRSILNAKENPNEVLLMQKKQVKKEIN